MDGYILVATFTRPADTKSALARMHELNAWTALTLSTCNVEVEPTTLGIQQRRFAGSTVEKPLNIHRIGCAETRLLKTSRFFSNIRASSIQSLSSQFALP